MRIEINLNEETATAIQKKADKVNQSRKGYIEFLCMQDVAIVKKNKDNDKRREKRKG